MPVTAAQDQGAAIPAARLIKKAETLFRRVNVAVIRLMTGTALWNRLPGLSTKGHPVPWSVLPRGSLSPPARDRIQSG